MLVEELAAALEQLNAAAEGWLGPAWREVPAFVLLFGALFAVSLLFWYYVVGLGRIKAATLASCTMSTVHGALSALGGYEQLVQWGSFEVDQLNTHPQKLLNEFSLVYMVADFIFFLLPFTPDDYVHMIHHSISVVYLVGCLLNGRGAIGGIFMFFLGEVTSPVFNAFRISKELRHHSKAAFQIFTYTSPLYAVSYIGVRSFIGPPVVGWFVYTLWFRSTGLPTAWCVTMGSCVTLGMIASQIWSFKLLRGFQKRQRRDRQLMSATKKA